MFVPRFGVGTITRTNFFWKNIHLRKMHKHTPAHTLYARLTGKLGPSYLNRNLTLFSQIALGRLLNPVVLLEGFAEALGM